VGGGAEIPERTGHSGTKYLRFVTGFETLRACSTGAERRPESDVVETPRLGGWRSERSELDAVSETTSCDIEER